MPEITIIIPVGPEHEDLARRAEISARNQTIPVEIVMVYDRDGLGAGWARNRGIDRAATAYILFLDADDLLAPGAAEAMLAQAQANPGHYVYTDWLESGQHKKAADCCWCRERSRAHLITALLPTAWGREVRFDESLPALEDRDFWLKLRYEYGREGVRLPLPLLIYSPDGYRSRSVIDGVRNGYASMTPAGQKLRAMINARYGGMPEMGCCVGKSKAATPAQNVMQPGDVQAVAQWIGVKKVQGQVSGRIYRGGNRRKLWVDPRDVALSPRLFKAVKS